MMVKLFLLLGLAALGALAQDVKEVDFYLEGNDYTQTVVNGIESKYVVVPKQGDADHTIILHDFNVKLTVFKDLTTQRCVIIALNQDLTHAHGIIFKDSTTPDEGVPSDENIILDVEKESIDDVEEEAGEKIANFCREFPSFRAGIVEDKRPPSTKSKRVKRGWFKKAWRWVKKNVKVTVGSQGVGVSATF